MNEHLRKLSEADRNFGAFPFELLDEQRMDIGEVLPNIHLIVACSDFILDSMLHVPFMVVYCVCICKCVCMFVMSSLKTEYLKQLNETDLIFGMFRYHIQDMPMPFIGV